MCSRHRAQVARHGIPSRWLHDLTHKSYHATVTMRLTGNFESFQLSHFEKWIELQVKGFPEQNFTATKQNKTLSLPPPLTPSPFLLDPTLPACLLLPFRMLASGSPTGSLVRCRSGKKSKPEHTETKESSRFESQLFQVTDPELRVGPVTSMTRVNTSWMSIPVYICMYTLAS